MDRTWTLYVKYGDEGPWVRCESWRTNAAHSVFCVAGWIELLTRPKRAMITDWKVERED